MLVSEQNGGTLCAKKKKNTFHQSTMKVILFHFAEYLTHQSATKSKNATLSLQREPELCFSKASEHRGQVYFFKLETGLMQGLLISPPHQQPLTAKDASCHVVQVFPSSK